MSQNESPTVGVDKPVILLDMDGVIADFIGAVIESHQLSISHDEWTDWNYHNTALGMSNNQFWKPTNNEYWWFANVDPYPWTYDLIPELAKIGHILFCSTPNAAPDCAVDKARWIDFICNVGGDDHTPLTNHQEIVFTQHKHLLAKPNAVLIDDKDENVDNFIKAGGSAVLFPQPWNTHRAHIEEFRKDVVGNTVNLVLQKLEAPGVRYIQHVIAEREKSKVGE